MKFIKDTINFNSEVVASLSQKFDLDPEIIKLLFARGFDSEEKINNFLNPSVTNFHNPFLLKNMREVVDKINYYIKENKRITIVGDYDTDGICATAILYKYFESIGFVVNTFLPQRLLDGYGLSNETIDKIIDAYNPDLIITVDCGISSYKEVEYCKEKGIDIIITDHHDIPDILPDTLVINAKLEGQLYPFKELCGAGVAFKLVQAMSGLENALQYTAIACLATVADIVPLVDENRAIVFFGLNLQEKYLPHGVKKLIKKIDLKLPINTSAISFKLSPKLNAPGRMGDASIAYNIFVEHDDKVISENINTLLSLNDDRITQTNKIFDDCLEKLKNVKVSTLGGIVLWDDNWEGGVLGIICSKLVERYGKPVCLLSLNDQEYKGSVRSIRSVNVHDTLNEIKDVLIRFGGHSQAGGLSVKKENIELFAKKFNETILKNNNINTFIENKKYDLDVPQNLSVKFLQQVDRLEPFGLGNEKPIYKLDLNNVKVNKLPNFPQHLKIKYNNLDLMAFNYGNLFYNINSICNKQVLLDLNVETFKNKQHIKGVVRGFSFSPLTAFKKSEIPKSNYLKQLNFLSVEKPANYHYMQVNDSEIFNIINNLTEKSFGTIIATYDFKKYQKAVKLAKNIQNFELYNLTDFAGINTIIFAPDSNVDFSAYENVVLLDYPACDGYIYNITNSKVYIVNESYNTQFFTEISTDRKVFGLYHNAIKDAIKKGVSATNEFEYFLKIKALNPQYKDISYAQFCVVVMVLNELEILNINGSFSLEFTGKKSELKNSAIFNNISLLSKVSNTINKGEK